MTYLEAQNIIEEKYPELSNSTTLVQKMVYQGWTAKNTYCGVFRNWNDEISEFDRESLNQAYGFAGLKF